jgi:hypothetical protein
MSKLLVNRTPRRIPRLGSQGVVSATETAKHQANFEVFDRNCRHIFEQLRPKLVENCYN